MTVDHRLHYLEAVRSALSTALLPLQYAVDLPVSAGHWLGSSLEARSSLLEENRRLRESQLLLESRLQTLTALENENQRLRQLLQSSEQIRQEVLIAELYAVDLDPFKHQIMLNKGSNDGVHEQQPVIDAHGVVGQVTHVSPLSSTVLLITDASHALPVTVERTGLRTIALGTGNLERLALPHLPNTADVQVGDLLLTSGLGGRFPAGYPVARIEQIERDPSRPFADISARPTAHLDRAREVLLIKPAATPAATSPGTTAPLEVAP